MRAFASGRCFWCRCTDFGCPNCGRRVVLLDVEDELHMGDCPLCGPMDAVCDARAAPRDNILGAYDPDLDSRWPG